MKLIVSLFLAAICLALPALAAEPYSAILGYKQGDNRKNCSAIEDEIRAANPAEYKPIEQRLLATLTSAAASTDCKVFVCRQLMIVGSDESIPALAQLLTDDKLSFGARFALERNPSSKAAAALREALPKTADKLQIGIISSIGARHDAAAVPALARLAAGSDDAISIAAIKALGNIPDAAGALQSLTPGNKTAKAIADAQLDCARGLAARGDKAQAVSIYRNIKGSELIEAAAFKGLIAAETPAAAVKLATDAVEGADRNKLEAAVAAVRVAPKDVRDAVAAAIPGLKPQGQAALLAALVDQAEITLRPALLKLAASPDAEIRAMAIEGLVNHGEAGDVAMLVKLATGTSPDALTARKTLDRMGKPGVDDALGTIAAAGATADRQVAIKALTNRKVVSALPALSKLAADADKTIAVEALKALADIGTAKELPAVLGVLGSTTDAQVRRGAEESAKSICTRSADKAGCASSVAAAAKNATAGNVRAALLRVLNRLGDDSSLAIVREMATSTDNDVKDAAVRALVEWPALAAAPDMLDLMKTSPNATYQVLALRGYVRLAGSADAPMDRRISMYRDAIAAAKRDDAKKTIIAGLGDLPTPEAFDMLAGYIKENALANEVGSAAVKLARNLGALAGNRAKASLHAMKASVTSDDLKRQIDAAIAEISRGAQRDGFVIGWLVAGPYEQAGKDHAALFDIAFPPEKDGSGNWRPAAASPNNLTELDKLIGGQNRVAYLKTILSSDKAQEIQFEFGSDDGLKVFLNGKPILANNATRPCTPGSDRVKARLNQGVNTLIVKVTQGGGEWSAVCRLRSSNGGAVEGVSVGGE